jgi:HEAT repeat protein
MNDVDANTATPRLADFGRLLLLIALGFASLAAVPATQPADGELVWHHTLKDAYAEALKQRKPILLVLGADWCQPCKVLDKEMATPEAAKALARWTRVHLDVDHSDGAAAMLQSGAIPLLRVLSPTGRRVDFKEGAMPAADLIKWLDGAYEGAIAATGEELLGSDAPDAPALAKLIERLADPDAALREAAIKRLAPHPAAAANAVAQAFTKGNLLTRLACLDLLADWKAPLADIDPWQPETLTAERLKKIQDWAAAVAKAQPATQPAATKPAALAPPQLEEARREIARLLAAPTQDEARALRERLARLGKALLPEVQARLQESVVLDTARERLLALRYRLVASDALALGWPAGLERLASNDSQTRHAAAEELLTRATEEDGPLLLELFADSDPLMREISLRGLQTVGKGDAGRALVALLNDPDLNVRAAVLKQLAESPSAPMLTAVIDFAKKETDPDLVVHAVRVLRESKADRAIDGLLALLDHGNWRVRAEAAEALAELTGERSGSATPDRKAQVNVAMVKLLDDPDGFVVSRAVTALSSADVAIGIDAMAKAAAAHPELAGEVIRGMAKGTKSRFAAEQHLRAFCSHKDDKVRSQAIAALCSITGNVEKEMKALLKDDVEGVRMIAAASLFTLINSWRPNGRPGTHTEGGFFGFGSRTVEDKNDPGQWATDFRAGKGRPSTWLSDLVPDLEKLTSAKGAETRLDGALPLLALTAPEKPLEVIRAAIRAEPRLGDKAAGALPWLATEPRIALFKELTAASTPSTGRHGALGTIATSMAIIRDPQAAPALWELLADKDAGIDRAEIVYPALLQLYFGDRYYSADNGAADATKTQAATQAKAQLTAGSEMQRLVGLALLLNVSLPDAGEAALKIYQDPATSDTLRADALQIRLLAARKADGIKTAIEALASPKIPLRRMALKFLATGGQEMNSLRGEIYLNVNNPDLERNTYVTQNTPVILDAPPGVTVELIKPLLADNDLETAAYAGYLLALMGDRSGLDSLLSYWRNNTREQHVQRLAYRAAAALRADDMVPVLEQIYAGYEKQQYYVREFYWTIRLIGGDGALKLRKKIRDEIGMQQLR